MSSKYHLNRAWSDQKLGFAPRSTTIDKTKPKQKKIKSFTSDYSHNGSTPEKKNNNAKNLSLKNIKKRSLNPSTRPKFYEEENKLLSPFCFSISAVKARNFSCLMFSSPSLTCLSLYVFFFSLFLFFLDFLFLSKNNYHHCKLN